MAGGIRRIFICDSQPFTVPVKLAGPAPVRKDGLNMRASAGRLELGSPLSGIGRVQVRHVRGGLVAEVRGGGVRELEIPTTGWTPGVFLVSVRGGAAELRGAVAIPWVSAADKRKLDRIRLRP